MTKAIKIQLNKGGRPAKPLPKTVGRLTLVSFDMKTVQVKCTCGDRLFLDRKAWLLHDAIACPKCRDAAFAEINTSFKPRLVVT